jgi:hypothetical protein
MRENNYSSEPYVMFRILYVAPCAWVLRCFPHGVCPPRYPNHPLYSPRGMLLVCYKVGVIVGLNGMYPSRITRELQ